MQHLSLSRLLAQNSSKHTRINKNSTTVLGTFTAKVLSNDRPSAHFWAKHTPGKESLLRAVSVCTKTTLIRGNVVVAGEWSHTCTLGTFLLYPLALSMPTYSNFQINRTSGETFNFFVFFRHFYYNKSCNFLKKGFPKAPFIRKLHTQSQRT